VLLARALVLLPLASCTLFEDDPEQCTVDASTELGVVFADEGGNVSVLDENGQFPLISAPQGGFIALLAPRMKTKVARCQVQISAALRDMTSNLVVGLEQRPVTLTRQSDGWAIPPDPAGLSDLANVAICPPSANTAIDGHPFAIEVKVIGLTTADSPSASTVGIPSCNGSQDCTSECAQSF
jgi:hypothetical protein